jgi:hypothetical protein
MTLILFIVFVRSHIIIHPPHLLSIICTVQYSTLSDNYLIYLLPPQNRLDRFSVLHIPHCLRIVLNVIIGNDFLERIVSLVVLVDEIQSHLNSHPTPSANHYEQHVGHYSPSAQSNSPDDNQYTPFRKPDG